MEENRSERVKRFADVHMNARLEAGKSQEYMALELGVSKKTIQNWEKGISSPSFFQSLEWFRILNVNAFQKYMAIIYPERVYSTKSDSDPEDVNKEFEKLCDAIPLEDRQALLYIFHGNHGSSAHSLIQLLLAHAHLPLSSRVTCADMIHSTYALHKDLGTLICQEDIQPDLDDLEKARRFARLSVINCEYGYSIIDKE